MAHVYLRPQRRTACKSGPKRKWVRSPQSGSVLLYDLRLDASDFATFEYLREHRHERPSPIGDAVPQESSPLNGTEDDEPESETQSVADDDDDDVFKLIVRSGVTKDITLKVRPTTSCGAIVKAFLKRAGLADKYPGGKNPRGKREPRLMVDGEHMDPETLISEAELEDGDQVEVDGLQP